ncbi:MAG: hypothetical protein KAH30_02375 [Caldisericia bacterium]|nr:hypothetical protein [Caldisericia bacterium]
MKYRMVKISVTILLALITFIGLVSCKPERTYVYDKESQELAHMIEGANSGVYLRKPFSIDNLAEDIYKTLIEFDTQNDRVGTHLDDLDEYFKSFTTTVEEGVKSGKWSLDSRTLKKQFYYFYEDYPVDTASAEHKTKYKYNNETMELVNFIIQGYSGFRLEAGSKKEFATLIYKAVSEYNEMNGDEDSHLKDFDGYFEYLCPKLKPGMKSGKWNYKIAMLKESYEIYNNLHFNNRSESNDG